MSNVNNVLMIGWEYPPHNSGGLGVACEGLTEALFDKQTQIYFTLPYQHSAPLSHMTMMSCQSPAQLRKAGQQFTPPFGAYTSLTQMVSDQKIAFNPRSTKHIPNTELEYRVQEYANAIFTSVKQTDDAFDVIHAHDWMTYPAARLLKKKLRRPMVAHIHSTEFDRVPNGNGNGYIAHTEYEGLKEADRVIAVSEFTKNILIDKYDVPADKIDVVHNGIKEAPQIQSIKFAGERPVIVFMGRLTMQKGAEYFLQLARAVLAKRPDALFIVAGHGDQYSSLLLENARQQLSSSLLYTGFLRGQQKDFLLDRADVFVMPSISEPFGLVALEAVQRETPVIISKSSGVREVLPGAIAVDFWDVNQMVTHIDHLLSDPGYYEQIVNDQLRDLGEITWAQSAEKVKAVYKKILQGKS